MNLEVETMSWRRFRVLLSGLSSNSRFAQSLQDYAGERPDRVVAGAALDAYARSLGRS